MKYTTFAVTALALAASTVAVAQTSGPNLTLYGIVDANVQVLDGASKLTRVQSGGLSESRLAYAVAKTSAVD